LKTRFLLLLALLLGVTIPSAFACRIPTTDQPTSDGCGDSLCIVQTCISSGNGDTHGFSGQNLIGTPIRSRPEARIVQGVTPRQAVFDYGLAYKCATIPVWDDENVLISMSTQPCAPYGLLQLSCGGGWL
jgi:hypothetical protein